jgi:hypothetical protein
MKAAHGVIVDVLRVEVPFGNTPLPILNRLLKNAHLRRFPHPSSLQRTFKYAPLLRISGALHLGIFDQPKKMSFSTDS